MSTSSKRKHTGKNDPMSSLRRTSSLKPIPSNASPVESFAIHPNINRPGHASVDRTEDYSYHHLTVPTQRLPKPLIDGIASLTLGDEALGACGCEDVETLHIDSAQDAESEAQSFRFSEYSMPDRLQRWLPWRKVALCELLQHEGLGSSQELSVCACGKAPAAYKCGDCFGLTAACGPCTVASHVHLPFHRIKRWDTCFYEDSSLNELGFVVSAHEAGSRCKNPETSLATLTVFELNGVHTIKIRYCNCIDTTGAITPVYQQLLRLKLFPASQDKPRTVFTFDLLDFFHKVTLQGKTNLYDFYYTILSRYDNVGIKESVHKYNEFAHVVRIYRFLKSLKRSGWFHSAKYANDRIAKGSLAVECPACPILGVNCPKDFNEWTENQRWLLMQFLAIDGNFRLWGKDRGYADLPLDRGGSYFVEDGKYKEWLRQSGGLPVEENTCQSQLDAVLKADKKQGTGYTATGVGAVVCSRHSLVRKHGVGDFQKGKKFCNIDYVVISTLRNLSVPHILLSYDVCCQYHKHFLERTKGLRVKKGVSFEDKELVNAIPKFHLPMHGPACHTKFSLNFLPLVGRTYGEGVESEWAHINNVATSIREMLPSMRHEVLNDHWSAWNWQKITNFGLYLFRCYREAFEMRQTHTRVLEDLSANFAPSIITEWTALITAWNIDQTTEDPYQEVQDETTYNEVRLELLEEEAALDRGNNSVSATELSPVEFITLALNLEEDQLIISLTKATNAITDKVEIQDKRNHLYRRIKDFQQAQDTKMPVIHEHYAAQRGDEASIPGASVGRLQAGLFAVEQIFLGLPSALSDNERLAPELKGLIDIELRLRYGQIDEALSEIRKLRRQITGVYQFKILNVSGTGQKANTRIRAVFTRLENKVRCMHGRYNSAFKALSALQPNGEWSERFLELQWSHITGLGRGENDRSEGRYKPSWIWLTRPKTVDSTVVQDHDSNLDNTESSQFSRSMRLEWTKLHARVEHWKEELELLQEEMQRVVVYLKWKASWWESQQPAMNCDPIIANGAIAYACEHAHVLRKLVDKFVGMWTPVLKEAGISKLAWN